MGRRQAAACLAARRGVLSEHACQPRGGAPRRSRRQLVLRLTGADTPTLPPSSPYVRRAISDVFPLLERVRNGRHRRDKRHELEATSPRRFGPLERAVIARSLLQGHLRATVITEREEKKSERS